MCLIQDIFLNLISIWICFLEINSGFGAKLKYHSLRGGFPQSPNCIRTKVYVLRIIYCFQSSLQWNLPMKINHLCVIYLKVSSSIGLSWALQEVGTLFSFFLISRKWPIRNTQYTETESQDWQFLGTTILDIVLQAFQSLFWYSNNLKGLNWWAADCFLDIFNDGQ